MGFLSKVGKGLKSIGKAAGGFLGGNTFSNLLNLGSAFLGYKEGEQNYAMSKEAFYEQQRMNRWQREKYERRIQDVVEDATAAGVHPLYAIGAASGSIPSLSTGPAPQKSGPAEALHRYAGARRAQTAERVAMEELGLRKSLTAAQIKELESASVRNLAEAQAVGSDVARRTQNPTAEELFVTVPTEITRKAPGVPYRTAGTHAGQQEVQTKYAGKQNWYREDLLGEIATFMNVPNAYAEAREFLRQYTGAPKDLSGLKRAARAWANKRRSSRPPTQNQRRKYRHGR